MRYLDARERSQKALIGTIEATIRAVEEAEEEIKKPPQIDLPHFGETQRHWRVEVEKEAVSDRLAAMGAATAEVGKSIESEKNMYKIWYLRWCS